jgi:glucose/arabinose dehydrogenase
MDETGGNLAIAVAVGTALLTVVLVLALLGGILLLAGVSAPVEVTAVATNSPVPTPAPVLSHAQPVDGGVYRWQPIADNLDSALYVTHAGDGSGRLFAVEQSGAVLLIPDDASTPRVFLDISDQLPSSVFQGGYTEQGLLGIAFHPDYGENRQFFVSYTDFRGESVLTRYGVSANPDEADPDSAVEILRVPQPFPDHNGGHIVFGPDGYLYMGFGDGGNVNEPNTRSLDPALFLGKIIRIDVNSIPYSVPADNPFVGVPGYLPEIWAQGLRNPWRFSFDRATGEQYIADVGQWKWEEVNVQPADVGGQNYGWSAYEGSSVYLPDVTVDNPTMPVLEYSHDVGCSISGGYVYRGSRLPELNGYYFYGDYCNGMIWAAYRDAAGVWQTNVFMDTEFVISSFGEDEDGELYLVDYKSGVYRLTRP